MRNVGGNYQVDTTGDAQNLLKGFKDSWYIFWGILVLR
jgi:hypothetical protein